MWVEVWRSYYDFVFEWISVPCYRRIVKHMIVVLWKEIFIFIHNTQNRPYWKWKCDFCHCVCMFSRNALVYIFMILYLYNKTDCKWSCGDHIMSSVFLRIDIAKHMTVFLLFSLKGNIYLKDVIHNTDLIVSFHVWWSDYIMFSSLKGNMDMNAPTKSDHVMVCISWEYIYGMFGNITNSPECFSINLYDTRKQHVLMTAYFYSSEHVSDRFYF